MSNVVTIMREACGPEMKVGKETKDLLVECTTEFLCFLTMEACRVATERGRKALKPEDVVKGAANLGFERYIEHLGQFMRKPVVRP